MHHTKGTFMIRLITALFCLLANVSVANTAHPLISAMQEIDANVVFMRHALAPGVGDPANFQIGNCSTQRNLDGAGRAQAVAIGHQMREAGIAFSRILSSKWCRCLETAQLLDMGLVTPFDGLNSFFQGHADRQSTLNMLRDEISRISTAPVLLVTHQVVITAITQQSARSGELVLYNTETGQSRRLHLVP